MLRFLRKLVELIGDVTLIQNSRMMTMLLGKSELVEHKGAENRGLTRRLEQMQQLLSEAETSWNKVISQHHSFE